MYSLSFGLPIFAAIALAVFSTSPASAGTIFVDDNYSALYEYTTGGAKSVFSYNIGSTDLGLAFNSSGTLYAAARDSNAILQYSPSGVESTFATVNSPYAIAVNAAGDVFTASSSIYIMEYTTAGVGTAFATAPTGSIFSMAIDSHGDLFAGDDEGNIYEYAPNGTRTTFASGIGAAVDGLAFDAAGNLYAADWNSQILKFAPNGSSTVFASFSTSDLPTGLVYDFGTGDLYMSEVANGESYPGQQSIFAFSPTGVQSTFASGLYLPDGIADLQSSPTPEPGSFVLLGGAMALIGLRNRLRKH